MNGNDEEAIKLFKKQYGITPHEAGFPKISIYEKQTAFLYATSEEVINAYKMQQNIIRWLMKWFICPLALAVIMWAVVLAKFQDACHPLCIACYIFYGIWVVLLCVLWFKVERANKLVKIGETVTFLNY